MQGVNHNDPVENTTTADTDADRAEYDAWKADRDAAKVKGEKDPKDPKPPKGEEDRGLTGGKATYKSARAAGKTSRNDTTLLHDKLVVVLRTAGIAWPKDGETSFHTVTEDDYDEGDGLADDQPRHAGELQTD